MCLTLLSALPVGIRAQAAGDLLAADTASARAFVREFYDWYYPLSRRPGGEWSWVTALRESPKAFTDELRAALTAEVNTAGGYEYSLRYTEDPLLFKASFCKGFGVGELTVAPARLRVRLLSHCHPEYDTLFKPTIDVVSRNGVWQFDDVHNHDESVSLRGELQKLVERRREAGRRPVCLNPDSIMPAARAFAILTRCMAMWIDSIESPLEERSEVAVHLLGVIGGRRAVDAFRPFWTRDDPDLKSSLIYAMATTGTPEDRAFLRSIVSDTGKNAKWSVLAATVLGFLRDTASAPALQSLLEGRPDRTDGHTLRKSLMLMNRPPCADSIAGDLARELLRILMECRDMFLYREQVRGEQRYRDASTGGIWTLTDSVFRERPATPSDSMRARITAEITIAESPGVGFIRLGMHCGPLCGEGWTYRLVREGRRWRVVVGRFAWVS